MRRIAVAVMTTISGLVLLFSYHTSRNEHASTSLASGAGITEEPATPDTAAAAPLDPSPEATEDPTPSLEPSAEPTSEPSSPGSPSPKLQAAPKPTKTTTAAAKNYLGDAVDTHYGPVQVRITVRAKKIVKAGVTQVPMDNPRDVEINTYAVPLLDAAAVRWQTADLQSVSGATFTSDGYKQSLQSAIDKAGL
jgi:uncharacterized protein with FMN-binding domain